MIITYAMVLRRALPELVFQVPQSVVMMVWDVLWTHVNPLLDSVPTRLLMAYVAIASVIQNIVTPPSTVCLIRLQPVLTSALTKKVPV
jgi:hypothetical protein